MIIQFGMQRIINKEIQKQEEQEVGIQFKFQEVLQAWIDKNQSLKSILEYCLNTYKKLTSQLPIVQTFGEYCPMEISKIILKPQLIEVQELFNQLPKKQCRIQHFLLILIQVMDLKFQEVPKYLVGFFEIFKQIKSKQIQTITYDQFFRYIVGQVTNLQESEQDTEFQVHFKQNKKQDYLLHDNGIKKIYFVNDLKIYLVLDQNSQLIKVYNTDMKIVAKYQPNKQRHKNRFPKINYFDFNQFGNKLGITFADNTFELVNLVNFLSKQRQVFESLYLSYLIFPTQQTLIHLQFIQMTNKWVALSQTNKVYLFHPQKPKQSQQQLVRQIRLFNQPKQELRITDIIELVPISTICFVAGNQVIFFDENLIQRKTRNYKHGSNIKLVKYVQQKSAFYILGDEKALTVLTHERNHFAFKYSSYPLNHNMQQFQIFPSFQTIIIIDSQHYLHLYDLKTAICYETANYAHIAKKPRTYIRIFKTSKFQFLIFQSYITSMNLQKVALQKEEQYNIDSEVYFDEEKQELYMSINNQILNYNILNGQIMKIYNSEQYFMPKYSNYLIDLNNQPIVLDTNMNIFYIEKYKKQIKQKTPVLKHFQTEQIKHVLYNRARNVIFLVGRNEIYEVQNNQKTLQTSRQLIFQNIDQLVQASYMHQSNCIFLSTFNHYFYLINLKDFVVQRKLKLTFPRDKLMVQQTKCIQSFFIHTHKIIALLTNKNQLYLISLDNPENHFYIKLLQGISYKEVNLDFRFIKMVFSAVNTNFKFKKQSKSSQFDQINVMLSTLDGHFMKINLTSCIINLSANNSTKQIQSSYCQIKNCRNRQVIDMNLNHTQTHILSSQKNIKLSRKVCQFQKRHQKQIIVMKTIFLEKQLILTVSKDGEIKLSENEKTVCASRLPNLVKKEWNTQDIEKIKILRASSKINCILLRLQKYWNVRKTPRQIINTIRNNRLQDMDFKRINHEQPIPIQFQMKDIQQLVNKQISSKNNQSTSNRLTARSSHLKSCKRTRSKPKLQEANKSFSHPWRQNRKFINIFQSAPSDNKYMKRIPRDLIHLRRSLDMIPIKQKMNSQRVDVKIIPQLNLYKSEQKVQEHKKPEHQTDMGQVLGNPVQDFSSCYHIKSGIRNKRSNVNGFDQIDKHFSKKQSHFLRRHVPKKQSQKQQGAIQNKLSKSLNLKKPKKPQTCQNYNLASKRSDPIGSILQLFEKHNREVIGTKFGRQIRISQDIRDLKGKHLYTNFLY